MNDSRFRFHRHRRANIWRRLVAGSLFFSLIGTSPFSNAEENETENAKRSDRLVQRGRDLRKIGDLQGSRHDLNEAIRLNPYNVDAYVQRGITRAQAKDFDGSYFDFEKAEEIDPGNITALFGRGLMHEMKNDINGAMQDFEAVLRLKPDHNMATYKRGILKFGLGQYEEAIEDFTKVIDRKPRSAVTLSARGLTKMHTGDLAGAIDDLDSALYVNPRLYRTLFARGKVYLLQGKRKAALFDFEKALQINRQYPDAYLLRGLVHLTMDRYEEALADLEKTLSLYKNPEMEDPPQLLLWFTRMYLEREDEANQRLARHLKKRLAHEEEGGAEIPDWYAAQVRFQLGEVKENSRAAPSGDDGEKPGKQNRLRCKYYYYTALHKLLHKDAETAIPLMRKCLQTDQYDAIEYIAAGLQLRKLRVKLE